MRLTLAALLLAALPALAEPSPRPADTARLAQNDAQFGAAIALALAGGSAEDVALLTKALRGRPGPLDPAGDWSCRVLKLGGLAPLVTYPPFTCRITPLAEGRWRFEKLSGSQRTTGEISVAADAALYLGVGYVGPAPATGYKGLPPDDQTPREPGQTHAQVGFFQQPGPTQARLLLPAPLLESAYDILWLTR